MTKQYSWALRSEVDDGRRYMAPREAWGEGPWQDEPDLIEWRSVTGLPCLIVRASTGSLCGYVGVPPVHPDFARHYDRVNEDHSHGGLTYSGYCMGKIGHVPQPGETALVWWLGFDCAHAGDLSPAMEALMRPYRERAAKQWFQRDPAIDALLRGTYRHVEYVAMCCEALAYHMWLRRWGNLTKERWWWWHLAQAKQFFRQDLPVMWKQIYLEQTRYGWRQDEWEQLPWVRGQFDQ